jgi:1,2-diacylglycerol 3-alpha-glucosyltransferase
MIRARSVGATKDNSIRTDIAPEARPVPLRVALLVANYGNYHLARARALTHIGDIEPSFIELAAGVKRSPWWTGEREFDRRIIRLSDSSYEEAPMRQLSRQVLAVLSQLEPAVVVIAGYSDPPMRSAARWARRNSRGVVLMGETTEWDLRRHWWKEFLKRAWIRRYVDAAVVGGQPHRSYIVKLGIDPKRVWDRYDVVDNEYFSSHADALRAAGSKARIEAGLPEDYFLFVGRFAPEKGLQTLLRAYRRYRQQDVRPWSLVLVGDGPLRAALMKVEREEGIEGVVWAGPKLGEELPRFYGFAGCFILPSILEPWGLVVNEAMASGLPVIVSNRCGSAADLVVPGVNGFVFDAADVDQLGALMSQMAAKSREQRHAMGMASRKIIASWSPERWAAQVACAVRVAARWAPAGRNS